MNTLMRRVSCETLQREIHLLEVSYWEASENYLGVALIQPGDSVTIIISGFMLHKANWVEPRDLNTRPFSYMFCMERDFFM